jgi:hypothetical protein
MSKKYHIKDDWFFIYKSRLGFGTLRCPDAKYIVMMLPQSEWANTWDSFIHKKHRDISTGKMAESDESGDEGFTRMERIVPPSPQSRRNKTARRTKTATTGVPRKALTGGSTKSHKRQRTK